MPCKMHVIASCFNMKTKFVKGCISKKTKPRTASPIKAERTYVSPKSSESSHKTSKGAHTSTKIPDISKSYSSHAYVDKSTIAKHFGPKQVWVPKKTYSICDCRVNNR